MRRRLCNLAAMGAVLALCATSHAENDDMVRARQLKLELKYRAALDHVARGLARGGANAGDVAKMHRLAGELAAGLGDADESAAHFARYLALDPRGSLEAGASPKLTDPFLAARDTLAGRSLTIRHRVVGNSLELEIDDPVRMVRAVALTFGGVGGVGGEEVRVVGESPYQVALPPTRPLAITARALDEHENTIARLGDASSPIVIAARTSSRPIVSRPLLWLVVAGASSAAATGLGLFARRAQSDLDELTRRSRQEDFGVSFDELKKVERRGKRYALAANIGFGVAGASALAAGVLWLLGPSGNGTDESDESVEPLIGVGPAGGMVGARVRF